MRLRSRWWVVLVGLVVALVAAGCGGGGPDGGAGGPVRLTIAENAVRGGKNASTAEWIIDYVIPTFQQRMAEQGRQVTVEFIESGIDDEDYKARLALDLSVGQGADILGFDSFWLSEFVVAGYLKPLDEVVGADVDGWEGWAQIPDAVSGSLALDGQRYGVPFGTDGRVLYFRKDVFARAGLPPDWQPRSWGDLLAAARQIEQALPDVTPLQINAGVSMGEATTLQGFIPILLGTGAQLYDGGWLGDTPELREALGFFETVYQQELGDAQLQVRADARDRSFQEFAEGRIAILLESDFFWRSVITPDGGTFPIANRDEVVGWAKIPAMAPGAGIRGQDFVSASGGTGRVLNPNTQHPQEAWQLLSFMGSKEAITNFVEREPRITARTDVNETAIVDDPVLRFVAEEVLPITWYRPGYEAYPQISQAIQRMTENVVAGRQTVEQAAAEYAAAVEAIVGADDVRGG
jgi:multiple sugar transport system substrate-binding protein